MAAPPVDFLNSFFWQFTTVIVAIVAVIGFLIYRYYLEPPISRAFMSAKWKKGPVGFVQDDANVVHLVTTNEALPEGVIHTRRGWFLQSRAPFISTIDASKRGPGRPKKADDAEATEVTNQNGLSELEDKCLETVLQAPILEGFGKAVFFGYDGAPLVTNLKTSAITSDKALLVIEGKTTDNKIIKVVERFVGHADLRVMKEIIPATISRTQLGNLHRWSLSKGYMKRGGDQMKLLYIAIAAAIPIACLGIVAFLLLNGGGGGA